MITVRRVLTLSALPFLLLLVSTGQAQSPRLPLRTSPRAEHPARIIEQFPINTDGDHILLPVKLRDKEYLFELDTGASMTVYDSSLKPILGQLIYSQTVDTSTGRGKMEFFHSPQATIGKLSIQSFENVGCLDLDEIRRSSGLEIYGILGMDFLKNHVVSLDFDEGRLTFLELPGSVTGELIPLYPSQMNCYAIYFDISGVGPRKLMVDSGSDDFAYLEPRDFSTLIAQKHVDSMRHSNVLGLAGGDRLRIRYGILDRISFGSFQHTRVGVHEAQDGALSIAGLSFLRQYNIVFDFPNQVAYFRKSRFFGQSAKRYNLSGLVLDRKNRKVIVLSVHQGSPAQKAGIRSGDILNQIDGIESNLMSTFALSNRLGSAGHKLQLVFDRKGRPFEVSVTLPSQVRDGTRSRKEAEKGSGETAAKPGP